MINEKETLQAEYKLRFSGLEKYRNQVWNILCNNFFQKYIGMDKTILDLGSGYGEFSNNIQAKKKYAMDLNPDGAKHLSENVDFCNCDCSKEWPIEKESLDVVFSSNFLEHLYTKNDVEKTIEHAYKALKPGGKIVLLGPNIKILPGEYWDFWDHHVPITENSIAELLTLKGFNVKEKTAKFLPYSMSDGKQSPLIFVKLYLKLRFAWRIFGKQFFVVAEKKQI